MSHPWWWLGPNWQTTTFCKVFRTAVRCQIHNLPSELLVVIFLICIPEDPLRCKSLDTTTAPMSLCQVSSHWRQIMLDTPKIWVYLFHIARFITHAKRSGLPRGWGILQSDVEFLAYWRNNLQSSQAVFPLISCGSSPGELKFKILWTWIIHHPTSHIQPTWALVIRFCFIRPAEGIWSIRLGISETRISHNLFQFQPIPARNSRPIIIKPTALRLQSISSRTQRENQISTAISFVDICLFITPFGALKCSSSARSLATHTGTNDPPTQHLSAPLHWVFR